MQRKSHASFPQKPVFKYMWSKILAKRNDEKTYELVLNYFFFKIWVKFKKY